MRILVRCIECIVLIGTSIMEELKQLTIKNYYYDPKSIDKLNSIYYISNDTEDDYVRITLIEQSFIYLITYVVGCEEVKLRAMSSNECPFIIEKWINKELEDLQKC